MNYSATSFTLVEVIIAATIFLTLSTALSSVCFSAMNLTEHSQNQSDVIAVKRQLKRVFQNDLQSLRIGNSQLQLPLLGEQLNPELSTLSFSTSSGKITEEAPWSNYQKISYQLQESELQSQYRLLRLSQKNLLQSLDTDFEQQVLLEQVETFTITYLCDEGEQETYNSLLETSLPYALVIHIIWNQHGLQHHFELFVPIYQKQLGLDGLTLIEAAP